MKKNIGIFLCLIIGAYFIFSGSAKIINIEILEYTLVNSFGINWSFAPFAARFIIGLEFLLGIFLCFQIRIKKITIPCTLSLMLAFTIYVVYGIASKNPESCNCLGDVLQLTPLQSLIKNIVIIALLITGYKIYPNNQLNKFNHKYFITTLAIFSLASPFILYPVETQVSQFKYVDNLNQTLQLDSIYVNTDKAQIPSVDFREGKHIVAFLSLTCQHCRMAALKLATLHKLNPRLPIYFVLNGKEKYLEKFHTFTRSKNVPQSFLRGQKFVILAGLELPTIMFIENGVEVNDVEYPDLTQKMVEEWTGQ
jgi:thiol-disulfide isomerase/thioredoxin